MEGDPGIASVLSLVEGDVLILVCPEHEHWQQRTLLNPLAVSTHYRNLETTVVDA